MKNIRFLKFNFIITLILVLLCYKNIYAVGDGNIDSGGGNMGGAINGSSWSFGNEGVRITIVTVDGSPITTPLDITNKHPDNIQVHFGKVSKLEYNRGQNLAPSSNVYLYNNPVTPLPKIISTSGGNKNIEAIKKYFCSEYTVKMIAEKAGFDYETLINGDYKLFLEPIAYVKYKGTMMAMTATEAALYDPITNGKLRYDLLTLSHQNLPLSMFLEVSDLGYPAWSGSRNSTVSNSEILSSLGLGIVKFKEQEETPPEVDTYDYEYRVNTDVITSIDVKGGEANPDNPLSAVFSIGRDEYRVDNIYYPNGDSQLVWVRWTTPDTPQVMYIYVSIRDADDNEVNNSVITANIVDLSENEPPNPLPDDRNDSFTIPSLPNNEEARYAMWGKWIPTYKDVATETWQFYWESYSAYLDAEIEIVPDEKSPTATGDTMKSGYGVNIKVSTSITTNSSDDVTDAQTAITYFPEFEYETYWRLLERTTEGYFSEFEFKENEYSTYNNRTHFTPIWYPDEDYTVYTHLIDCWTPTGMLSINLNDMINIRGSLWDDWHIAPMNP